MSTQSRALGGGAGSGKFVLICFVCVCRFYRVNAPSATEVGQFLWSSEGGRLRCADGEEAARFGGDDAVDGRRQGGEHHVGPPVVPA